MNQRDNAIIMGQEYWLNMGVETKVLADRIFAGLGLTSEMLTGETEKTQEPGPSRYELIRKKIYENQR